MNSDKLNVTVVGGGNSAHILIPLLAEAGHQVSHMTRRPEEWNDTISFDFKMSGSGSGSGSGSDGSGGKQKKTFRGTCSKRSKDPADVIPDADAIILCMPVHQCRNALGRIAPHIDRSKNDVFVGTMYGQGGFNWMVHEQLEQKHQLTNIVCFAFGLIPWNCRAVQYGSHAANYGGKKLNVCAVSPPSKFETLNALLLKDISLTPLGMGPCVQACSFLSLTLSVENQVMHPARCLALSKRYGAKWDTLEEIPLFYIEFDDLSNDILRNVDEDYSAIRTAVKEHFPDKTFTYMMSYLGLYDLCNPDKEEENEKEKEDVKKEDDKEKDQQKEKAEEPESYSDNDALPEVKTPTVLDDDGKHVLDIHCRYFTDDIPYGLLVAKWIAQQLNIDTPHVDECILWAQSVRGEHWLNEDDKTIDMEYCKTNKDRAGLPPIYGIDSVDDLLD